MTRVTQSPQESSPGASRRQFLQWGTAAAAASSLANVAIPRVHAAENNTIRLALIGCGGRGSGAVGNAMNSIHGPVQLYAMADVAEDRLARAHKALADRFGDRVNVPKERQFVGFDAYKKAIDCLGPNDVAMLTSFAYVRPLQLEYAVQKGVNVFMEKSFAPDAPNLRRMMQAGEEAKKKNLKIMAGLQCRHSVNRQELIKRIRDGQLGEIMLVRAYRVHPAGGRLGKKPENMTELMWQIRNFTSFLWVSGGLFAEMNIHQIDELVLAQGRLARRGPRHRRPRQSQQQRPQPGIRLDLDRMDLPRRHQGDRRRPLAGRTLLPGIRHVRARDQVRRPVLRRHPRGNDAHLQGPAEREGQHRLGGAAGEVQPLGRRMERAAGQHPQGQAAERGRTGRAVELRRLDGPRGRPFRDGDHLGTR